MIAAILSLTVLGAVLGMALGIANRFLQVEGNPLAEEITALMPGSNCGQCGFPGCSGAAAAMADGQAAPTICPALSKAQAQAIAAKLGVELDLSDMTDAGPKVAAVCEDLCIGCCRCARACSTDGIIGASRQIHHVLSDACTGCGSCIELCPTEALQLQPLPVGLAQWVMPLPVKA